MSQSKEAERPKTRKENMLLNMGPSHPSMHGIVRIVTELEGERVVNADVEIGYLHRAFEKSSEQSGYLQVLPYTDRLNYVSPLINNVGYCLAIEKMFGLKAPERAQYIRVIMSELSRVCDHLTCIGANAMELGAFTAFLYLIKAREFIYELIEEVTGARVTISYTRIGGVKGDLPKGFSEQCYRIISEVRKIINEVEKLLTKNKIFIDRLKNIGRISQEDAIGYGITGPFLRSTGIDYDVRRANPYLIYDRLDFDIPVGTQGDNLDRYLCRIEEMKQSLSMIEQALKQIPKGEVLADVGFEQIPAKNMVDEAKLGRVQGLKNKRAGYDPTLEGENQNVRSENKRVTLPPKEETYRSIEGLMNHFKVVMDGHGLRPPQGETYLPVEGANGELGFYVVSDGTGTPYRVRVRPPCFTIMSALPIILKGDMLSDVVATFGSVNMIGGELDR